MELIDEWLELGEHSGYLTYVLETRNEDAALRFWATYPLGPTPLTELMYYLYCIAVEQVEAPRRRREEADEVHGGRRRFAAAARCC